MIPPYQKFGRILNTLRKKYHTTKKELCATLEIDEEYLSLLELGVEKPSEDLVAQVIGHFSLDERLADNLWILAGYPIDKLDEITAQTAYLPINELKISYTDLVHVSVNNFGIVLNFMQSNGLNNQPIVVSRLGMSKEHALSVVDVITRTLKASAEQQITKIPLGLPEGKHSKG